MKELIWKQDALFSLMEARKHLLTKGQKGAEHILTHYAYNVIDELPLAQLDFDITVKIDKAYDDGFETGYAQAKADYLSPAQPTITHEQAIDYLHKTGWLQNHDRILTESKVSLKGIWRDFTDEGYVECPFCKSATNCESKEEIDDIHFCFSCGAMLKKGETDVDRI